MKKLIIILSIFIFNCIFLYGQEAIYAVVQNDSVTIWHTEAYRNCGCAYKMEFNSNGNDIDLYEVDTLGGIVQCMCYFDLSATITSLAPGYYEVDVYSLTEGVSYNDTTFHGSTSFTILSGDGLPQLMSYTQSDCYDPTSIENQNSNNTIKLFPNPADDFIYIGTDNDYLQFQIQDLMGKVIFSHESLENSTKVDLSGIQSGIYFIIINSSGNKTTRRFIKL